MENNIRSLIHKLQIAFIPILKGETKEDVFMASRALFCAMIQNIFDLSNDEYLKLIENLDDWCIRKIDELRPELNLKKKSD